MTQDNNNVANGNSESSKSTADLRSQLVLAASRTEKGKKLFSSFATSVGRYGVVQEGKPTISFDKQCQSNVLNSCQ